jgi:hypothetical protein
MPFAELGHEVARRRAPDDVVFVSYADNHPVVLAHVRALFTGPSGTVDHIDADLNDPSALPTCPGWRREHAGSPARCSYLVISSYPCTRCDDLAAKR